ncbi:MAG TPA: hypothetical protein VF169_08980 [Albitalea sp.]|uniref:hypothetical protein n=1 Tax=Piscinibacter sp. TaxID=1903157 RepID=UPI002ED2612A
MSRHLAATALACCALLTACGGGGGDAGAAAPIAGLYEGSGGSNAASELLILGSGRYYLVYGLSSASAAPAGGVIVGDGTASGSGFASTNAHDFNLQSHTLLTGTLNGTIAPRASANMALLRSDGTGASFSGGFDIASGTAAKVSDLVGTYGGELAALAGTQASVLTVDASGALAGGTTGSCTYAGLALPHSEARVFDITLNFQAGCPNAGSTLHGHAFLSGKKLYAVVASGDLAAVALFAGVKP